MVDGAPRAWDGPVLPLDSLRMAARAAVRSVQAEGHYRARLDSAAVDSSAARPAAVFYVSAGPQARVGEIAFSGNRAFTDAQLQALMETRPGRVLRQRRLEDDLDAILRRYEDEGFPLVQVRIERFELLPGAPPRLALGLSIDEGSALRLKYVEIAGEGRTDPGFVARVAGLEAGAPLSSYDPEALRERLRETELFETVGQPELLVSEGEEAEEAAGGAVVRVPLKERSPGTFDLALGYLPPSGEQDGRLVGSGSLALRNLFGHGRTAALQLDRRPGSVSRFEAEAADPFFLNSPVRLSLAFEGLQEDSTYARQHYALGAGYRVAEGLRLSATVSREVTTPGIAGGVLRGDRQRIARATALLGGVGVRLRRLDRVLNPRSGVDLEARLAYGRKERSARRVTAEGDTARQEAALAQQRLEGTARLFVPAFARQVVALGAEASALLADEYDRSDLFFLGGVRSLRGYDEDRFRGNVVGRAFAEYRYLLDRRSFAYAFFDLGYARRPDLPGEAEAAGGLHPGYGLGIQFTTRLGLVNASYALNDEDGLSGGRVHLGLAVGL